MSFAYGMDHFAKERSVSLGHFLGTKHRITLELTVTDETALWRTAADRLALTGMAEDDIVECIGTACAPATVECLMTLCSSSWLPGCGLRDMDVEFCGDTSLD